MSMKRPLVIYLAAPYTAKTQEGVIENIARARVVATHYRRQGAAVIIPHQESLGVEHSLTEPEWLAHCLALAERCDIIIRLGGPSKGADLECAWLKLLGKKVVVVYLSDNEGLTNNPSVDELRQIADDFRS